METLPDPTSGAESDFKFPILLNSANGSVNVLGDLRFELR